MADSLVLDASAAVAMLRDEPRGNEIARLVRAAPRDGTRILVPSVFWLEIANVIVRRYRFTPQDVVENVRVLDALGLETVDPGRPLLLLAVDRMWTHGLSAYDASYLALAESVDASLLTLDDRLRAAAPERVLPRTGSRFAEAPAPYRTSPSDVWARNGAWLAALRAEARRG